MHLSITQINNYYLVEIGDQRMHMLNKKSLLYFLKNKVGLDSTARAAIVHTFEYQSTITINLAA